MRNFLLFTILLLTLPLAAQKMEGMASFYADKFDGKLTSTGEVFRQNSYMAASKDLPWGTIVEVTNISNGRKVQVRINDCGPHAKGRIIDLSRRAAQDLDFIKEGETKVSLRIVRVSNAGPNCARGAWSKKLKAAGQSIPTKPGPWKPSDTAHLTNDVPAGANTPSAPAVTPAPATNIRGFASYYADRFEGNSTSTGEIYSGQAFTAASKTYPYNTTLEVTNVTSGQKVTVRVNDCGPHDPNRLLDLSRAAADQIGLRRAGTAAVDVRIVQLGTDGPTCERAAWGKKTKQQATVPGPPTQSTVTPAEVQAGPGTYSNTAVLSPYPAPATAPAGQATEKAYNIQLGAFRNEASAYGIYDDLVAKGYVDALVYKNLDNGLFTTVLQTVYNKETADAVRAQAVKDGFVKAGLKKVQAFPSGIMRSPQSKTVVTPPIVAKGVPAPESYGKGVAVPVPAKATPAPAKRTFEPDAILFGVQIGAYTTAAGVKEVKDKLDAEGVELVYAAKVGKMTRVFAGKFYFQSQATVLRDKLRESGYPGATVRRVQ